jgi:hypothetical protein
VNVAHQCFPAACVRTRICGPPNDWCDRPGQNQSLADCRTNGFDRCIGSKVDDPATPLDGLFRRSEVDPIDSETVGGDWLFRAHAVRINGHHHGRHREVIVQSFRSLIDALLCQPVRHGFEVVANVTLQFLSYSLNLQKTSTDRRNRMSNPAASVARETTSVPALNEHSSSGLENSTASLAVCDHTHLPRVVYAGFLQGSCSLFDSHSL